MEAFFVASLLVRDTGIGQSFDESGSKIRIQHFSFSSEDPESKYDISSMFGTETDSLLC